MDRLMVLGKSRSGTTITQTILNSHPDIQIFNEQHIYTNVSNIDEVVKRERKLYNKKSLWFGDKQGMMSIDTFKLLLPLNIKHIFIYRDGRDVVSSGIRLGQRGGVNKAWKTPDQRANSKGWAHAFRLWDKIKEMLPPDNWCEIRFEDYLEYPGKNATIIAEFLDIDVDKMITCERSFIKPKKSHRGYHSEWCPDWKNTFHPDAIELLKTLEYVEEV